jgi:3-deoxy-D-manno-octulosonic-acid transferase
MHAPSAGEGLQARPVLALLRERRPDLQLAYSFYSPSAEKLARSMPVDVADYLPFDTAHAAERLATALRPQVLAFSKLDVWPMLCATAGRHRVPTALISATVSPRSGRRRWLARALLHDAYAGLDAVGAVSPQDADRLVELGVRPGALTITGDTRYDQVWERAAAANTRRSTGLLETLQSPRPTVVAGSTWPSDEAVLFPAWELVRRSIPQARLIVAPHEPTPAHLAPIEGWARGAGLTCARLSEAGVDTADVVLVDTVGVLGDIYALAGAAFVGGGFHAAGLHSVLEPAAFGAPVAFGPRHQNSRDATLLIEAGGGAAVADATACATALTGWLGDKNTVAGSHARRVVESGRGAAERSFGLVLSLLAGRA